MPCFLDVFIDLLQLSISLLHFLLQLLSFLCSRRQLPAFVLLAVVFIGPHLSLRSLSRDARRRNQFVLDDVGLHDALGICRDRIILAGLLVELVLQVLLQSPLVLSPGGSYVLDGLILRSP